MTPGIVTTRGSATVWVHAEFVDVTFTVRKRAATTDMAVAGAGRAYGDLEEVLDVHEGVITRTTTQAMSVRAAQQLSRKTGAWVETGFEALRSIAVRISPVEDAGEFLHTVLAKVADVSLDGPVFGVSHEHPAMAEVRGEAIRTARESAEHYAKGLGLTLGHAQRITDMDEGGAYPMQAVMSLADSDPGASGVPVLADLAGEAVALTASVELVMELADSGRGNRPIRAWR